MSFASNTFIFYFLPTSLIFILIAHKLSNKIYKTALLFFSYLFCFWLDKETLLFVILISVFLYLYQFCKSKKNLGVASIVILLLFFKYLPIIYKGSNHYIDKIISWTPIAISFVSLSAISFIVDITKDKNNTKISFIDLSLYISYFPRYISGPIIKWKDFNDSLNNIQISLDNLTDGFVYFIKGLLFKLVIADSLINSIQPIINNYYAYNTSLLILCIFTYSFVIYFDFLGYSKMAKGISKMLGIEIQENFNYPYKSRSISEFYRRWHMSLGQFFKEYVYIPLGGNKKNVYLNLFIVMLLSGIWHGEGISYILWGIINGIIMIFERKFSFKRNIVFVFINYLIVSILWMPFMLNSMSNICSYVASIFSNSNVISTYGFGYYFNIRTKLILIIAIVLSFIDLSSLEKTIKTKTPVIYYLCFVLIFIISIMFMINSSYSPFIYFRF